MNTPILRFVLILSILLPVGYRQPSFEPVEPSSRLFLPLIGQAAQRVKTGNCQVVNQTPQDGAYQAKGTTFPVRWIIRNTSEDTWRSSSVTINYVSGGRYHSGNDGIDLPYDVLPGGMLDWTVNLTAPSKAGSYVSNWAIREGLAQLCSFYIAFKTC